MIYLIQGVFFQNQQWLDVAYIEFDMRPVIRSGMIRSMYCGAFGPDPDDGEAMIGTMTDHYGEAMLTKVKLSDTELSFTKQYVRRDDLIRYVFRKHLYGTWRGEFQGSATGTGEAHCVLTPILAEFLGPTGARNERSC